MLLLYFDLSDAIYCLLLFIYSVFNTSSVVCLHNYV